MDVVFVERVACVKKSQYVNRKMNCLCDEHWLQACFVKLYDSNQKCNLYCLMNITGNGLGYDYESQELYDLESSAVY